MLKSTNNRMEGTMNREKYPPEVEKFISELLKRNVISRESLSDKTLINFLYSQKYDTDFIETLKHDKYKI